MMIASFESRIPATLHVAALVHYCWQTYNQLLSAAVPELVCLIDEMFWHRFPARAKGWFRTHRNRRSTVKIK